MSPTLKSRFVTPLLALTLALTLTPPPAQAAAEDAEKGWTPLLNGKDLDGWKVSLGGKTDVANSGTFTMKDGVLICSGSPSGYLYTPKSYRNYTLEFDLAFKRPAGLTNEAAFGGNSGCLIHIAEPNALGVWPRSIEVQGMNKQMGLILPIPRSLKCTKTFDGKRLAEVRKPLGEFNRIVVKVRGGDMDISINGTPISTVRDCELTEGPIGFQSEGVETHWKNLRVREE